MPTFTLAQRSIEHLFCQTGLVSYMEVTAEAVGLAPSTLRRIRREPEGEYELDTVVRLAKALGVPVATVSPDAAAMLKQHASVILEALDLPSTAKEAKPSTPLRHRHDLGSAIPGSLPMMFTWRPENHADLTRLLSLAPALRNDAIRLMEGYDVDRRNMRPLRIADADLAASVATALHEAGYSRRSDGMNMPTRKTYEAWMSLVSAGWRRGMAVDATWGRGEYRLPMGLRCPLAAKPGTTQLRTVVITKNRMAVYVGESEASAGHIVCVDTPMGMYPLNVASIERRDGTPLPATAPMEMHDAVRFERERPFLIARFASSCRPEASTLPDFDEIPAYA
jgi:transcriptional regulator with XRE-family HTH domain